GTRAAWLAPGGSERGTAAGVGGEAGRGGPTQGARAFGTGRIGGDAAAFSGPDVGRATPAGGDRPSPDSGARGAPDGRAVRGPRSNNPRRNERGAFAGVGGHEDYGPLCHAQHRRGGLFKRPGRGLHPAPRHLAIDYRHTPASPAAPRNPPRSRLLPVGESRARRPRRPDGRVLTNHGRPGMTPAPAQIWLVSTYHGQ